MLTLLAITAIGIVTVRSLFAVVMLTGMYSLLTAGLFVVLDAVDVAFTEAAVGAGITTVLLLGTLALVGSGHRDSIHTRALPLVVVVITGGA
ncbi:MAG: hydrogenase subunit MbhD domain-containing protein, partial [Gammaproteobacteria bacterium]